MDAGNYSPHAHSAAAQSGPKWPDILLAPSIVCVAKKWDDSYKSQSTFLILQVRRNMETVLIVLLVVFLLGGGGWGYSRLRG